MISERQLSDIFDSFWQHYFPLLNATFMRRFNVEHRQRLCSKAGVQISPAPMGREHERYDLISEIAFEIAATRYHKRDEEKGSLQAIERALARIANLRGVNEMPATTSEELAQADRLLENYEHLFDTLASGPSLRFRPRIKGAGILDAMEGDFCSDEMLFEVKAVNRNIHSSDLRQMMCYLIAGRGSGEYSWKEYCVFNPRRAVYYRGGVDELISYLSGRDTAEVVDDFLDALMEREQSLEMRF